MAQYDYDLIVIGAGSGGVRAGRLAAQLGKRVAIVEKDKPGGTCVLRGCVPKKLMVYAAQAPHKVELAQGYGWDIEQGTLNWPKLRDNIQTEVHRLSDIYKRNLAKAGAELLSGHGKILDPHTVDVDGRKITTETILIATGSSTRTNLGFDGHEYAVTSDDMFHLPDIPKRSVVLGAGFIALEFACILNGYGTDVTVAVRRHDIFNDSFDLETRRVLKDEMQARGIKFAFGASAEKLEKNSNGMTITFGNGDSQDTDLVLAAFGRDPNTTDLGLEDADIKTGTQGEILVDDYSQTNIPSIYAIGDVTNRMNLTPVAIREGVAFVETVFKGNKTAFDYHDVPVAVFSQPEMAGVGLTEETALNQNFDVKVFKTTFKPMKTYFPGSDEKMFLKLVVDQKSDRILGAHMVGEDAGEIMQTIGIAVKAGLTKTQFDQTCALHPTASEEWVTM